MYLEEEIYMLNSVTIKGYQSLKDIVIEFSPTFTVLTGVGNVGKTAVFRAIRWVTEGRPLGTPFMRDDQDFTNVLLSLSKGDSKIVIAKDRDSKNSCYAITTDGGEPHTFEGTSVPDEIAEILNLSDINIQDQFSPYFLILDPPGKVARYLNSITGLDEVDSIIFDISKAIRTEESKIALLENDIKWKTDELEKHHKLDLDDFKSNLDSFISLEENYIDVEIDINALTEYANKLETLLKNDIKLSDDDIQTGKLLADAAAKYNQVDNDIQKLELAASEIELIQKWLIWYGEVCEEAAKHNLEESLSTYRILSSQVTALKTKASLIETCDADISKIVVAIDLGINEKNDLIPKLVTCPKCKQQLSAAAKEELLSNL
jgi:chromosome segregation ATPase